jgi:cell division protein FtsW (lipid II flippase)
MANVSNFRPKKYRCPICGERTTFGSHFCKGEPPARRRLAAALPLKRIGAALVALILVVAMLWSLAGPLSLYLVAAILAVAAAAFVIRKSAWCRSRSDYKKLLALAGMDKDRVERLIAREAMKRPGAARRDRITSLIEEFERENR